MSGNKTQKKKTNFLHKSMGATFGRIESKGKTMPMYVHAISVRSHIFMA